MTPDSQGHPESTRCPVILDVDTGTDDALAILLALRAPSLRVLGITCVSGNVSAEQVLINTLRLLDAAGDAETPVVRGANQPLFERPRYATEVHGRDGIGDIALPPSWRMPESLEAAEWLRDTLLASPRHVTVVGLAPMTNLALLLLKYPEVKDRIERFVLMAGAGTAPGNTGPVAEFNVRADPEAADIVLRSGVPITLYTLDAFRAATVNRSEVGRLRDAGNPSGAIAARILTALMHTFGRDTTYIGDAGVVAGIIEPACLTMETFPACVELTGTFTRGQLVIDRRNALVARLNASWATPPAPRVDVTVATDAACLTRVFLEFLGAGWVGHRPIPDAGSVTAAQRP